MLCSRVLRLAGRTAAAASRRCPPPPPPSGAAAARSLSAPSTTTGFASPGQEYVIDDEAAAAAGKTYTDGVLEAVDRAARVENRLFAVVHLCGKQFKVTDNDLILVDGYWPPDVGDRIRLQKVLLAGGRDFTLIGRPVLDPAAVSVTATVVDKDLSHTRTNLQRLKRKQFMRINFVRKEITMLRINSVRLTRDVSDDGGDVREMGWRVMSPGGGGGGGGGDA